MKRCNPRSLSDTLPACSVVRFGNRRAGVKYARNTLAMLPPFALQYPIFPALTGTTLAVDHARSAAFCLVALWQTCVAEAGISSFRRRCLGMGGRCCLLLTEQPDLQPVEIEINHRRSVQREDLRHCKATDNGIAERLPDL